MEEEDKRKLQSYTFAGDHEKVFKLASELMEKGDIGARHIVASCLMIGQGCEQDQEMGYRLLKGMINNKTATPDTFCSVGVCYAKGQGVKKDIMKAHMYIDYAFNEGSVMAIKVKYDMKRMQNEKIK